MRVCVVGRFGGVGRVRVCSRHLSSATEATLMGNWRENGYSSDVRACVWLWSKQLSRYCMQHYIWLVARLRFDQTTQTATLSCVPNMFGMLAGCTIACSGWVWSFTRWKAPAAMWTLCALHKHAQRVIVFDVNWINDTRTRTVSPTTKAAARRHVHVNVRLSWWPLTTPPTTTKTWQNRLQSVRWNTAVVFEPAWHDDVGDCGMVNA